MKKKIGIVIIFICGILAFFVPYFFSNSWRKVACKRGEIHSDIYEREDVEHAMTLVEQTFPQEMLDCKMTKLSYDESAYRQFADSFRKQKSDEVILFIRILLRCSMHSIPRIIHWSPMRNIQRIHGYCDAPAGRRSGTSSVRDMVFCIPERYQRIGIDKAFHLPFFLRQHIRLSQGVV